jgi:hypothetical protein
VWAVELMVSVRQKSFDDWEAPKEEHANLCYWNLKDRQAQDLR